MATKKELREQVEQLERKYATLCEQYEATRGKLFAKEREAAAMSGKLTADALMNNESAYMLSAASYDDTILHPKLHVSFDLVYMAGNEPRWLVTEKNVSYSD